MNLLVPHDLLSMAEYERQREQFRSQIIALKRKAGLPPNFWHETVSIARYEVTKWKET